MMFTKRRSSLVGFILLAVGLVGFSTLLLLTSETERRETRFSEYVQNISGNKREHTPQFFRQHDVVFAFDQNRLAVGSRE